MLIVARCSLLKTGMHIICNNVNLISFFVLYARITATTANSNRL